MAMQYIQTGGDSDGYWIEIPDAPAASSAPPTQTAQNALYGGEGMGSVSYSNPVAADTAQQQQYIDSVLSGIRGANTGFVYSPQQLGWDANQAARLQAAGITALPGWFNHNSVYSNAFHMGGADPIQQFIDLHNTPIDQAAGQYRASGEIYDYLTKTGLPADDPAFKEAYLRESFGKLNNAQDTWWDRNGYNAVMSGLSIAVPAAFAIAGPAAAGAEAGAGGAGLGTGFEAVGYPGATAAGTTGGNALTGAGLIGGEYGFSNAAPVAAETVGGSGIADSIAAGTAAGADVGMGSGTSWLTSLGLPASYGSGAAGLGEYGLSVAGGGGGMGLWDSVSSLFGGEGGGNALTGSGLSQIISALIGAGGSYMGGQATQEASDDATKALLQMYYQSRADTAGQRALFDQIAPQLTQQATNPNFPTIPTLQNQVNVDYENDPIYQQQKNEIMTTLNRRMASQGRFNSSAADDSILRNLSPLMQDSYSRNLDTLNRTNQNALQTYGLGYDQGNNLYGRSLDLAKIGAGAASSAGQNALSTGNALAGVNMNNGQNQATMWGGMAGSAMGGINNYMLYNLLNKRSAA